MNKKKTSSIKIIAKNKRAFYDFLIEKKIEAGIELLGTEVKSLRIGKANLSEAFATIDKNEEVWLQNLNIPHYEFGNRNNHLETRRRKLLLHKKEIQQLSHSLKAKGLTLVPLALYFKGSLVKIEMGLGKGKKLFDKRQDQAKKDVQRKLQQGKYE